MSAATDRAMDQLFGLAVVLSQVMNDRLAAARAHPGPRRSPVAAAALPHGAGGWRTDRS
jgi:hypothetical protein